MASSSYRDDNGNPTLGYYRPEFSAAGVVAATTGAAIAETSISALNVAANQNAQGEMVLRVLVNGTNAAYFSLGPAATAPGSNATMIIVNANTEIYVKTRATDLSIYHQQITGASTLQVVVMK